MTVFDTIDRMMIQGFSEMMGTELDQRALRALEQTPQLAEALLAMRGLGRVELTQQEVMELVRHGLVTADRGGYYLSDFAEDFVDEMIRQLRLEDRDG